MKIENMHLKSTPVQPWTVYGEYPFEKCTEDFSKKYRDIISNALDEKKSYWWALHDNSENATLLIPEENLILKVRYGD